MQPVVTNRVTWFVGLSITVVTLAKTVEPIEMSFVLRTRVGPRNRVLDAGLRRRKHDKILIPKTAELNNRNFLIHMLYRDCY